MLNKSKKSVFPAKKGAGLYCMPILALCCTQQLLAQDLSTADEPKSSFLEEIVVTAQKRSQNLQDVSISIVAFSGEGLEKAGVENTWDLMGATPNLHVSGNIRSAQIFIRGVGSDRIGGGADSSSTVHIDGVYLSRPESLLGEFLDVERVEVLRGPQGTLYGRNSVGGSINVISNKPTKEFTGKASLALGNYDKVRMSAALSGPITNGINGRIAVMTSKHDPYTKNIAPTGVDGFNDEDAFLVRGMLDIEINENANLLLSADYSSYDDNGINNIVLRAENPLLSLNPFIPDDFFIANIADAGRRPFEKREYLGGSAILDWDLGSITFKSISAYRETNQDTFFITGAQPFEFSNFAPSTDQNQFSQEFQLSSDNDSRLEWILGAYYFTERSVFATDIQFFFLEPTLNLSFFADHSVNAFALFGQATYNITDRFRVTGGIRYSVEEKKRKRPGQEDKETWSEPTPKLVVEYDIAKDAMLYASFSEGFKSGTFDSFNSSPAINPEFVKSYEVGIKSELLDHRMRFNFGAFYYDYTDLQVVSFDRETGIFLNSNAGASEIKGMEIEVKLSLTEKLFIDFSGAYLDATYTEFLSPNNSLETGILGADPVDLSGNTLRGAPKFTYNLAAEYITPTPIGELSIRGGYQYRDDTFFSQYNSAISSQGAYGLVNAVVSLRSDDERWKLSISGRNLTNKQYLTSTVSLANQGAIYGAAGNPRTYEIKLSYKFY